MRYPSKKDSWIVFLIVAPGVALACTAVYHLFVLGANNHITWLITGIAAFYGAIIWALAYPVYYEITASDLLIRSGWLKFQISLSTIEMVRPTRNPLSAPAWSLDRLRIDYRKNDRNRLALISPENKARFLNELVERVSDLERQGDRVIRRPASPNP